MKTKLTLLLALAVSATANAEKPNFNGFKPSANASAAPSRSLPSSGGHSSSRVNAGQISSIARSILPLVMNAPQPAPPRPNMAKRSSGPVVNTNKPATRNVPKPGSVTRNPSSGSRGAIPNPTGGLDPKLAAGLAAGREIANGLQSLESLRASFGSVEGFGDVFHQPGNRPAGPGKPNLDIGNDGGFQGREVKNPLDRFSSPGAGLTDIRGGANGSRRGITPEELVADAMTTEAPGGTTSSSGSETDPSGNTTATADGTDRDGNPVHAESTELADGSGTNTTTHTVRGGVDTITSVRRDAAGNVTGSTSDTVNLANGKQVIEVRDGSGRLLSSLVSVRPGARGGDRSPSEGASLGGPAGPSVRDVSGLVPLDLLRQHANGEAPRGGVNYMTSGRLSRNQVNPVGRSGGSVGGTGPRVAPINILQPTGGGDFPNQ